MTQKERLSNIELLRIVAMIMVISIHFFGKCILPTNNDLYESSNLFGWLIRGISYMGVNLFIIISAYFQCRKTTFNLRGLLKFIFEVWIYSIALFVALYLCGVEFSPKDLLFVFSPILSGEYWFITVYFGLYIFSPFLNKFISALSRKEMQALLLISFLFFCVVPNIYPSSNWLNFGSGYGIVWFVVLYLIGGYLQIHVNLHDLYKRYTPSKLFILMLFFWALPLISKLLIAAITESLTGWVLVSSAFYFKNSIILLPASIITFLAFRSITISNDFAKRMINSLASGAFAVYLIHDNPFFSPILWDWIRPYTNNSSGIIFTWAISVIVIYITCYSIDIIRKYMFRLIGETKVALWSIRIIDSINNKLKPYIP